MSKKQILFRLSEEHISFLDNLAIKENTSRTAILEKILAEYQQIFDDTENSFLQVLSAQISESVHKSLNYDLTRTRLATNAADTSTQVLLEMMNSMITYLNLQNRALKDTDDAPTEIYREAKNHVKERIARYKQVQAWKKKNNLVD